MIVLNIFLNGINIKLPLFRILFYVCSNSTDKQVFRESLISQSPSLYRRGQAFLIYFWLLWRILCSMCCGLCGTQYTTVLNLVLIGPKLTIFINDDSDNMLYLQIRETPLHMRLSIMNNMPPPSIYDIRLKSNAPINQFHVFGDLDH